MEREQGRSWSGGEKEGESQADVEMGEEEEGVQMVEEEQRGAEEQGD